MPQAPANIGLITNTGQLPAAATGPVDTTMLIEISPAPGSAGSKRQKITANALLAGGPSGSGFNNQSLAAGLAAVGTNRGNSLALTAQTNIVATAASTAVGVTLPPAATIGVGGSCFVFNDGPSNSLHVYAAGSDTIDGAAGSTGVVLTNAKSCRYLVTAALTFVSYRSDITRSA